jgi:hypothetical protein
MMAEAVAWHGDAAESEALLAALNRDCACVISAEGVRLGTCAGHFMLLNDQRALNGLLWMRHIAPRLWAEEQTGITTPDDQPKGTA